MSGAHIVENMNNEKIEKPNISNPTASTPPNNEELLKTIEDLADRIQKLDDKLEDLKPFIKISRCMGFFLENPLTIPKKTQKTLKNPPNSKRNTPNQLKTPS